ncbi:two-component response regulator-like APRR2 isoform X2 [Lycium barbarum]|uniref:two-component response regulator-like APRR2 isoform X2 n=1 Tax=Lycium barbarum TaxID=112863 RepID=UPI00293F21BA|nr:two-component response regulator-like APRR2 isoform X2 [Lycium barbarum]
MAIVLGKKMQKEKAREELEENGDQMNIGDAADVDHNNIIGDEEPVGERNIPNVEERSNNIYGAENDVVSNEKSKLWRKRGRNNTKETNEGENQSSVNEIIRRKVCTEWTMDLHTKFMEVVQQLGEGSSTECPVSRNSKSS